MSEVVKFRRNLLVALLIRFKKLEDFIREEEEWREAWARRQIHVYVDDLLTVRLGTPRNDLNNRYLRYCLRHQFSRRTSHFFRSWRNF